MDLVNLDIFYFNGNYNNGYTVLLRLNAPSNKRPPLFQNFQNERPPLLNAPSNKRPPKNLQGSRH